jgi:hypothetical protein
MLPPIQQSKSLSLGAYNLILISLGVIFLLSVSNLSGKLVIIVPPPASTISEKKVFRKSISVLFIELIRSCGIDRHSSPIFSGENKISGARLRS